MINFEISEIIDTVKIMNPDLDFDAKYTFYYDETNNMRKFYLKEEDFNYSFSSNFVLGGFLYTDNKPIVDDLFPLLQLQKTTKELKFNHIAKGDFINCLKSQKLNTFLDYIFKSPLYVHYTSLNILYYSIVDIVDSAIMNSEIAIQLGLQFANTLKNDLYKLCKLEIKNVIHLFYSFGYPNIKKDKIVLFISQLTNLFTKYENKPEFHFGLISLKQILREAEKKKSLSFIEEEEDYILLKDLSQFYLNSIYSFRNSSHIFDNEKTIEEEIQKFRITYKGQKIENYTFEDSKNDKLIQISDAFIGLVGKFSQFINTSTLQDIENILSNLNTIQKNNLDLFLDIINKSDKFNQAFLHNIDSQEEMYKKAIVFEKRNKRYT